MSPLPRSLLRVLAAVIGILAVLFALAAAAPPGSWSSRVFSVASLSAIGSIW